MRAPTPAAQPGALLLAREKIDLRQPLDAMSQVHRSMLARLGIDLNVFLPEDPLPVSALREDLNALFAHVADLAVEVLTPASTVHVLARIDSGHAVVNWFDTGAAAPRLAPAFDAAAARARMLACRNLASRHGARIYTSPSPLGNGSLTLRFPLLGILGPRNHTVLS